MVSQMNRLNVGFSITLYHSLDLYNNDTMILSFSKYIYGKHYLGIIHKPSGPNFRHFYDPHPPLYMDHIFNTIRWISDRNIIPNNAGLLHIA